jgi:hypothetical protein
MIPGTTRTILAGLSVQTDKDLLSECPGIENRSIREAKVLNFGQSAPFHYYSCVKHKDPEELEWQRGKTNLSGYPNYTGMKWKDGWKACVTLISSSKQAKQKRRSCSNGYLLANRL